MAETADRISFELVSPEKLLWSGPVEMVVVPGDDGDFGVLAGHALFISSVRPGVIDLYDDDRITDRIFVAGGFAEVTGERCTVLAEEAIELKELTRADVEARIKAAEEAIDDARDEAERAPHEAELRIALAMRAALEQAS